MHLLELATDGFEENGDLAFKLDREVAVGTANRELQGDLEFFLVGEDFTEQVVEEDDRVVVVESLLLARVRTG